MTQYNEMQLIKREFFALRNGIVADNLRAAGAPCHIIFGLNLPQIVEIARASGPNRRLAEKLWANTTTRESLMLAPMIFPREEMTCELAKEWVGAAPSAEVIDVLCHRLLRHRPFAAQLAAELSDSERDLDRYCAVRLMFNLLPGSADIAMEIAAKESQRGCRVTVGVARALIDEINFLKDGQ